MRLWKGLLPALLLLALVAVMPAAAAPPAAPSPPPTLTGETLTVPLSFGIENCRNTGSFSLPVSGTAAGPYPGTFTETVTGTVNPIYNLATFSASFTIHSATGDVTGTKTYSGLSPTMTMCYQDSNDVSTNGTIPTTYQATIHTSQGNYTDHGTSGTDFFLSSGTVNQFNETFASSQTQTTLIVPTSADQCKDGGYQTFGTMFKNQGQCIKYVNEHSK